MLMIIQLPTSQYMEQHCHICVEKSCQQLPLSDQMDYLTSPPVVSSDKGLVMWRSNVSIHQSAEAGKQIVGWPTSSHHLNKYWLIIGEVFQHSPQGSITENAQHNFSWYDPDNDYFKFTAASLKNQPVMCMCRMLHVSRELSIINYPFLWTLLILIHCYIKITTNKVGYPIIFSRKILHGGINI